MERFPVTEAVRLEVRLPRTRKQSGTKIAPVSVKLTFCHPIVLWVQQRGRRGGRGPGMRRCSQHALVSVAIVLGSSWDRDD
jgi:hypothetical protein